MQWGRWLLLVLAVVTRSQAETLPANVTDTMVAPYFSSPSALAAAPDGRVFVGEQAGDVWLISNGTRQSQPFATLPADGYSDRGIMSILCDPDFTTDHRLYIYFTHTASTTTSEFNCIWTVDATANTAGATAQIWQGDPLPQTFCNGGGMVFGPDGKLYVATGDNDTDANAQSMTTTLGKVLRLNPDGSIPSDDPFVGSTTGPEQAIYCLGLRNPYTMAVQPGTGLIYLNDVRGTNNDEYVCQVARGANFGYPNSLGATAAPPYTAPVVAVPYGTSTTSSRCIAGGTFLSAGTAGFPSSDLGLYYFCDFSLGWLWTYNPTTQQVATFGTGLGNPIQLTEDAAGDLWYIARSDSSVHEITYTGPGGGTGAGSTGTGTGSQPGSTGGGAALASGSAPSSSSRCGIGDVAGVMLALALLSGRRAGLLHHCWWWLRRRSSGTAAQPARGSPGPERG